MLISEPLEFNVESVSQANADVSFALIEGPCTAGHGLMLIAEIAV